MLKVVGASWLQTRISTCILVAVALIGLGAVIFGEFGRVENDGTYSATVSWRRRHGYRIDFWGQGNDLESLPLNAARAYFRMGIQESGWSMMEIETSGEYPDDVQAYAAGLLEGSLTWQLVHQHWTNTIGVACAQRQALCRKMRKYLRDNAANARKKAATSRSEDPFWHMVHLYYVQLDGLAEGWRFGVERSRHDANIEPEDFLWLAMASDLPDLERPHGGSDHHIASDGMILLKSILGPDASAPLIALAHNTAAPYARMLRVMKRYKFAYHVSQDGKSAQVPGQSIVMTSYPGALSSHDESYAISGKDGTSRMVIAGTPLIIDNHSIWARLQDKGSVMSPARIMAANRLGADGAEWSRLLGRQNSGTSNRQWICVEVGEARVSLVEQMPDFTQHSHVSDEFAARGYFGCTGAPFSADIRKLSSAGGRDEAVARADLLALLQLNVSSLDQLRNLMRGDVLALQSKNLDSASGSVSKNESAINAGNKTSEASVAATTNNATNSSSSSGVPEESPEQLLAYRGDLAMGSDSPPRPVGVIDSKLFLYDPGRAELSFDARSGPASRPSAPPFSWARSFPNSSHVGQPDSFAFDSVAPNWVWIA